MVGKIAVCVSLSTTGGGTSSTNSSSPGAIPSSQRGFPSNVYVFLLSTVVKQILYSWIILG